MAVFPLQDKQDSSFFKDEPEDVAVRHETEGGYTVTRPRHTRTPRRTFTTGFTEISQADKATFDAFYNLVKGGSDSFEWTNPVTLVIYQVRIKNKVKWTYTGEGGNHHWSSDGQIELEQV